MENTTEVPIGDDLFDTLLSLEEQYHTEGYQLGVADGARAGRIEGRLFGTEKGFEKFLEMGRLAGRGDVWSARISDPNSDDAKGGTVKLPSSDRVGKHLKRLRELTDQETISAENSEDALSEFDDRLKDGKAKAKLISTLLAEDTATGGNGRSAGKGHDQSDGKVARSTGEMEDFAGLPGSARTRKV